MKLTGFANRRLKAYFGPVGMKMLISREQNNMF